jgi:membrane-bound ClpP family serine protease
MALGFIIAIILVGLLLIFLEIFFIPGTTLFGILGGVALLAGIILMYTYYGKNYGNITLGISLIAVLISIGLGFRLIESNKLAMKAEITGKVNQLEISALNLKVGDTGVTLTELRPNGKATFSGTKTEVYSSGEYIARNTEIEIVKITRDKIFIQPLKS